MTNPHPAASLTGRPLTEWIAQRVQEKVRAVFQDRKVSEGALATRLGFSETRVWAWWSTAHPPLHLAAHPETRTAEALAIVREVLELREEVARAKAGAGRGTRTSVELGALLVSQFAADTIALIARALADGHVDDQEHTILRRAITALRDRCDAWLRAHERGAVAAIGDAE